MLCTVLLIIVPARINQQVKENQKELWEFWILSLISRRHKEWTVNSVFTEIIVLVFNKNRHMITWFYMSSVVLEFVPNIQNCVFVDSYKFLCFFSIHIIHFCSNLQIFPMEWFPIPWRGPSTLSFWYQPRCPKIAENTTLIPYSHARRFNFRLTYMIIKLKSIWKKLSWRK